MAEYIEREKALKVLNLNKIAKEVIDSIPSADVQPVKRGEWLPIIEANEYGDVYQCGTYCSECGEKLQSEPNFCPNFGADMRGDHEHSN